MDATQIRLRHTLHRITESLELDAPLHPPCRFKNPCGLCNKNVTKAQKFILCSGCSKSVHIKCNGTSDEIFEKFITENNSDLEWFCLACTMKSNYENFPFTLCDNQNLTNINTCDRMNVIEYLPNEEILKELSQYPCFSQVSDNDDGELITPELLSSKYHTVHEFQNLNLEDRLNVFHSNVNGLECKFETLCAFLTCCKSPPNLIGITETSEQKDSSFITNVAMEGYKFYHTPTNISKGGCCIYVKNDFDVFERDDLKVQNDHFQSVWTEIKNKKSKNIIFGCIYRSPNKKT